MRDIENGALEYISKWYSLKEVSSMFLNQLAKHNFALRLKKIEIPEEYKPEMEFAKEGICWLIQHMLELSGDVYSQEWQFYL